MSNERGYNICVGVQLERGRRNIKPARKRAIALMNVNKDAKVT